MKKARIKTAAPPTIPTLAEKIAPNGYFFGNYDIRAVMQDGKLATFEFRYVIADLHRFRIVPLFDEIPNPVDPNKTKFKNRFVRTALRLARKIPNVRWLSNGMHFGGEVINGDLRGYELEDTDLSSVKTKKGSPIDKVYKRHYFGQYWSTGKAKGGKGSFDSPSPVPPAIDTVMSGAGVIILLSRNLDPDRTDYRARLKLLNKDAWGDDLSPLNPDNNRGRWAVAYLDQFHIVLAAVAEGSKNAKPKPGGGLIAVHHGLTVQQFAKEIKKIGDLISDKKILWAMHYDGSKPMGCAVAENALREAAMRATAYETTRTYMGLYRRVNGYIELIGGISVPLLDEEPARFVVNVTKLAPKRYEFLVQFRLRMRPGDKPASVTLKADPPVGLDIDPNQWSESDISLQPDGTWGSLATVSIDLNQARPKKNVILELRAVDAGGQELCIHRVPIRLVHRIRTSAILDNSGSMVGHDPEGNRFTALEVFSASYFAFAAAAAKRKKRRSRKRSLPPQGEREAALVSFSNHASLVTGFVSSGSAFNAAIGSVGAPGGSTNFNEALALTATLFDNGDDVLTAKKVIFFTDGMHNVGEFDWSLPGKLAADDVLVHTIGLGDNTNAGLLSAIASSTGGRYFHLRSASDMAGIYGVLLSDILDEDVSETLNDEIPVAGEIVRPVVIRGSGRSTLQITWDLGQPPPEIVVRDADGEIRQPTVSGEGFAVYQSEEFTDEGEWQITATASEDATGPTPIGIVVTEASGVGNRIRLNVAPIAARRFVGETLSFEASLTERGQPVPQDTGDDAEPAFGHARVSARITSPNGATNQFQMSQETGRTGVYLRREALVLNDAGVYRIEIIADGTDTSSARYRRSFQTSVVAAHRIIFADARVPATASEGTDMNVSARIAANSIQPDTVKLLGRHGPGTSFSAYSLVRSGNRWRGTVPGNALNAGLFESYFLAEGVDAHGVAPDGAPDALFETQVKAGPYAWVVEFKPWAANRHHAARARRMRLDQVSADVSGFIMPDVLRQPANFLIPRELISPDSRDGSLWCVHVENPMVAKPIRSLVHLSAAGQLIHVPAFAGVDVANVKSFAVDGQNRRLWLGFPQKLVAVNLETGEIFRQLSKTNILGLASDPATGGVWAGARRQSTGPLIDTLQRFGPDPDGGQDLNVGNVRTPGRSFLFPMHSGGVVCFATYARVPRVVRVNADGTVQAAEAKTRPQPIDMSVDPVTGRVWVVTQRFGRFVIEVLGPDLKLEKTIRAWEDLQLITLYSAAFRVETGDLWVSGRSRTSGVTGRIDSAGTFHKLIPNGELQGLVRS